MARIESRLTLELRKTFPDDFLWGASVSSHQVEGDTYNQWTKWELEHAAESASESEKRWSWIPAWEDVRAEAKDPDNYVSGHGIRHYKHYRQDFKIAKALGLNTFRFNIEWSRIEPQEGTFNVEALQHYRRYVKALVSEGLEPIVGLWHWTVPVWFEEKGGFSRSSNLKYWRRFVEKVSDELDWSHIEYALTMNEPNTYVAMSYIMGEFPHRNRSKLEALRTYRVLTKAHKIAYRVMKLRHPHLKVSLAYQVNKIIPKDEARLLDRLNARTYAYLNQWWFLGRVKKQLDFLGLNYYFTDYREKFQTFPSSNPPRPLNDLGWYMEPAGIDMAISDAYRRFKLPIIVLENGVADMADKDRLWWITETMHALAAARRSGAKVFGYCHWSLLDNFEWQYGWFPKFGLVSVNRETYKRTVKKSAKLWGQWLLHR